MVTRLTFSSLHVQFCRGLGDSAKEVLHFHYVFSMAVQWDRVVNQVRGHEFKTLNVSLSHAASCQIIR